MASLDSDFSLNLQQVYPLYMLILFPHRNIYVHSKPSPFPASSPHSFIISPYPLSVGRHKSCYLFGSFLLQPSNIRVLPLVSPVKHSCLALSCYSPQTFMFGTSLAPPVKHSCYTSCLTRQTFVFGTSLAPPVKHSCSTSCLTCQTLVFGTFLAPPVKYSCLAPPLPHMSDIRVWHLPCPTCQTLVFYLYPTRQTFVFYLLSHHRQKLSCFDPLLYDITLTGVH